MKGLRLFLLVLSFSALVYLLCGIRNLKEPAYVICIALVLIMHFGLFANYVDYIRVDIRSRRNYIRSLADNLLGLTSEYEIGKNLRTDAIKLHSDLERTYRLVGDDSMHLLGLIWLGFELPRIEREVHFLQADIIQLQKDIQTAKFAFNSLAGLVNASLKSLSASIGILDEGTVLYIYYNLACMNYKNAMRLTKNYDNRNLEAYVALIEARRCIHKANCLLSRHDNIITLKKSNVLPMKVVN